MSYEQARALMEKGVSRPTLYEVQLPGKVNRRTSEYLKFFCNSTAIPSISLQTVAANGHENQGIVREQPIAVVYGKPFVMTVIENSRFEVYKSIREWIDSTALNANQQRGRTQKMNYYNTFVSDMSLTKLENSTLGSFYSRPLTVTFLNAYPVSIGQISLGSELIDTATTFDVSFTYESYTVNGFSPLGELANTVGDVINTIDRLF
jgi:hypothetical protein